MQSAAITVRSGDVLTVYLDGLAGDTTTPDMTVRWFGWLRCDRLRQTERWTCRALVDLVDSTIATDTNGILPSDNINDAGPRCLVSGSVTVCFRRKCGGYIPHGWQCAARTGSGVNTVTRQVAERPPDDRIGSGD